MSSSLRWSTLIVVLVAVCGCRAPHITDLFNLRKDLTLKDMASTPPRTRVGSVPCSTLTTKFLGCSRLAGHSYRYDFVEKNGIIYTCSGGHLDIAHLRNQADSTAHLSALTYYQLNAGAAQFSFELAEDTTCHVEVEYPPDWQRREDVDKAIILYDVATGLGRYFTFQAGIWHEIATWFGYKSTGFYPEFSSAFSWEDVYSDLLGCQIGYMAMHDSRRPYDQAVTLALAAELKRLDGRPKSVAHRAADLVRGHWFSGEQPVVVMKGRNFDVGLDDGHVTPWLVPGLTVCPDARPRAWDAPDLTFLDKYGFAVRFEIEPRLWEKNKILAVVYPNGEKRTRIEPATQLQALMDYIERDAARRYGDDLAALPPSIQSTTAVAATEATNSAN